MFKGVYGFNHFISNSTYPDSESADLGMVNVCIRVYVDSNLALVVIFLELTKLKYQYPITHDQVIDTIMWPPRGLNLKLVLF